MLAMGARLWRDQLGERPNGFYGQWSFDRGKYIEFNVTITGFLGLDLVRPTVDTMFGLTIRIKELHMYITMCIEHDEVADVSYRGVPLA
ncbi:hypothetical protein GUJ93_ZPchr0012g19908 [Zizania palustris]|uniref:Uncharacterized protein n=1 Tax=Zizania palustris TaxID=103762 RepID=A0A8J5WTK7_ZIZPA|nr:hypothetical protein GUJ93_ZPchr0012g19908 [Zizania palustris]